MERLANCAGVPLLAFIFLAGCGGVGPTTTPRPSFLENCAPVSPSGSATLSCEQAISAALATLAPNHPPIVKVEFYYAYPCDPSAPCPIGSGDVGYVLVHMAAPDSDEWIGVVRHPDGSLTACPAAATTPSPWCHLPTEPPGTPPLPGRRSRW